MTEENKTSETQVDEKQAKRLEAFYEAVDGKWGEATRTQLLNIINDNLGNNPDKLASVMLEYLVLTQKTTYVLGVANEDKHYTLIEGNVLKAQGLTTKIAHDVKTHLTRERSVRLKDIMKNIMGNED